MLLTPVNTGNITVGRPKTTLDLTGAIVGFWDANVTASVILNGANVSEWRDLSGNNRHLIQATTGAQPAYTLTSGRQAISTDGVDDRLATGSFVISQPFSRFSVVTRRNSLTGSVHLLNSSVTSPNTALTHALPTNIATFAGATLTTGTFSNGQTSQFGEVFNSSSSMFVNNGISVSGNAGTQGIDGLTVGARITTSFSQNDFHSVLIVNRLLTTTERLKLESYFGWRWNISSWLQNAGSTGNPWRYHNVNLVY